MRLSKLEKETYAEENINLVYKLANKINASSSTREELVSVGLVAFTKALDTYKKDNETKFTTYATTCINNAFYTYLSKQTQNSSDELDDNLNFDNFNNFDDIHFRENINGSGLLTDLQKRIINLYLDINSISDIAGILDLDYKTVNKEFKTGVRLLIATNRLAPPF